jgi:hypothetical protein
VFYGDGDDGGTLDCGFAKDIILSVGLVWTNDIDFARQHADSIKLPAEDGLLVLLCELHRGGFLEFERGAWQDGKLSKLAFNFRATRAGYAWAKGFVGTVTTKGVKAREVAFAIANNVGDAQEMKTRWDKQHKFYPDSVGSVRGQGGQTKLYDVRELLQRAYDNGDVRKNDLPRIERDLGLRKKKSRKT